jgi:hypothetical protein
MEKFKQPEPADIAPKNKNSQNMRTRKNSLDGLFSNTQSLSSEQDRRFNNAEISAIKEKTLLN